MIVSFSNARKLFRTLKSLMEYQKINALIAKANSNPFQKFILLIIPRISYVFYWILDTLGVLAKIKVINGLDEAKLAFRWAALWTIANFATIVGTIVDIVEIGKDEAKIRAQR